MIQSCISFLHDKFKHNVGKCSFPLLILVLVFFEYYHTPEPTFRSKLLSTLGRCAVRTSVFVLLTRAMLLNTRQSVDARQNSYRPRAMRNDTFSAAKLHKLTIKHVPNSTKYRKTSPTPIIYIQTSIHTHTHRTCDRYHYVHVPA